MPRITPKNPGLAIALGKAIRQLREETGISQEEFAHLVGIERSYMGHIERGVYLPSLHFIVQIAEGLGVPPGALVDAAVESSKSGHG
jgi:transcriptional regulator with XRE-family HTH domain